MYFKFVSYLKFLLKSTNEHGVHSPFVFNFVTKCLYSKEKLSSNKTINLLLKSIRYFKFKNIQIDCSPDIEKLVNSTFPAISFDNSTVDILYTEALNVSRFVTLLSEGKLHNDSMVLVAGIHQNEQKQKDWESLIALPNITVSMDMFHCGAIFIRKEQVKEHFTIRI